MSDSRLVDVASAAGVSLRTASRVLNDDDRVASSTRARVREAMRALAFEPDVTARSLRAGTDTTIGLVVESIADPFFAEVIDAVEAEMAGHGRPVLVASTHRDHGQEEAIVRRMFQRRVAGLLVVPTGHEAAWLGTSTVPVVLIDRGAAGGASVDLVDIDDRRAAFDAVSHLVRHGHRHIAYIGDSTDVATSAARLAGYEDALAAHDLTHRPALVAATAQVTDDAARATADLLDRFERDSPDAPTAIFSATTRASLGIVAVLHSRRRTDLAFVGLGDFAMADALEPGVTVVDHSGARLGLAAAQRLRDRLTDPQLAPDHIRLATPLIERGSGELRP